MGDTEATGPRPGDRAPGTPPVDGRTARWELHRERRRVELVDSTIRAIRLHGAGVGMDEIAAEAGTSKTVIYRHLTDKAGVYRAVAARIDEHVVRRISETLALTMGRGGDLRTLISSTVGAYLSLVQSDPEVYRFVVRPPLVDRPLADDLVEETAGQVVDQLSRVLAPSLEAAGHDPGMARLWSIALVGSVQAVADDWLRSGVRTPSEELAALLTDLAWRGLSGALGGRAPGGPTD